MMHLFSELSSFSMRKAGAALCFIAFITACIGNLISTGFEELPSSYLAIIAGVFVFYFGKNVIRGIKVKENDKP